MNRRYALATAGSRRFAVQAPAGPALGHLGEDLIGLGANLRSPELWLSCAAFLGMLFGPQIGNKGPMILLAVSGVLLLRNSASMIEGLRDHWKMLIFPLYCLMTVFWSYAPGSTLRAGVELLITFPIALQLAQERRRGSIVTGIFLAFMLYDVVSLVFGHRVTVGNYGVKAFSGLNGGKNLQADTATLGLMAAIAFGLDTNPFRKPLSAMLIAFAGLLHMYLIIQAKSGGAFAGLALGAGVIITFSMLRKATPSTRLLALLMFVFFGAIISAYQEQITQALLTLLGKDQTLTGRSYLWYRAQGIIVEHPIEGHGYNAFWLKGNSDAEGLWRWGGITSRTGFNFHNSYYETMVALGAIGFFILVVTVIGYGVRVTKEYVRAADVTLCFWLGVLAYELFRTPFESIAPPGPLQPTIILLVAAMTARGPASQSMMAMAPEALGASRQAQRSRLHWRTARVRAGALPHPQTPGP